jgi:hypothetical protein
MGNKKLEIFDLTKGYMYVHFSIADDNSLIGTNSPVEVFPALKGITTVIILN